MGKQLFILLEILAIYSFVHGVASKKAVMPWMCLERCDNATYDDIQKQLKVIANHAEVFTMVSFEMFNLGPNSQLILNNLTLVVDALKALNLKTEAMISSYPYPKEFIVWMRQLFANPDPFFADCITQAMKYGYTGYHVDFEPHENILPTDAIAYADFLNKFANVLHSHGLEVSVAIDKFSAVWNWTALAATNVDKLMVMSTYAGNPNTWLENFNQAIAQIPMNKLGIGLQTVNPNTNIPLSDQELQYRFTNIMARGILEVDIWDIPLGDNWWSFLEKYIQS